ncbi:hypothetical protein BDW22DRAFT_406357 [Trametopsis cervina]|nr:hypothetical protein BDW22DRAFT_406357 [Trametopsis cervina]
MSSYGFHTVPIVFFNSHCTAILLLSRKPTSTSADVDIQCKTLFKLKATTIVHCPSELDNRARVRGQTTAVPHDFDIVLFILGYLIFVFVRIDEHAYHARMCNELIYSILLGTTTLARGFFPCSSFRKVDGSQAQLGLNAAARLFDSSTSLHLRSLLLRELLALEHRTCIHPCTYYMHDRPP